MEAGLEVFDSKEEDEVTEELVAEKFTGDPKNPSIDIPATLNPDLLDSVTQSSDVPRKENSILLCVDGDATKCDHACDVAISNTPLKMIKENLAANEENFSQHPASPPNFPSHQQETVLQIASEELRISFTEQEGRVSSHEALPSEKSQLNYAFSNSPSSIPDDMNSDDDENINDVKSNADKSMNESSPSTPSSNIAEGDAIFNHHASNNSFSNNLELADIDVAVDYVVYRDNYYTGCFVTFSCTGIKVNCSTMYGDQGILNFESGIQNIVRIESQYLERLRTVSVKVQILPKEAVQLDNADNNSGVEELEFAAVAPRWFEMWEDITALNMKYCDLWSLVNDTDVSVDGRAELLLQRPYFPNFEEAFEEVIYPKGDSDAVSISKRDVDLLQPETFINDTIIDFYIKYLKNQIPPEQKHRFHFFNSFFFRKLADLDKDPSSASDGRAAFLRVHKWTRKVDIFGKDYIFIPVNFNLHWSLLVICHAGEVASFKDEDSWSSIRVPCILHMDSIKGTHAGLKNLVQSYLWEEWKERHKEASEDLSSKFLNLRFVSLELPQQENSFDCGLFLLHYLELFLVDTPMNFNPFKINKFSKFLNIDWFPPAEASIKRTLIQRLVSELIGNRSQEVSSGGCSIEPQSNFPEYNRKKTHMDFGLERSPTAVTCHGNLATSKAAQGIEITLLEASSMRNPQCVNDPGLVLRELFEPGVATGSLLAQCTSFDQPSSYYHRLNGTMSQIEDDTNTGEQFDYFPSEETVFQQMAGITPQAGSISYSFRGYSSDAAWNPQISMQGEDDDSSSETSACPSDDSDVGIIENFSIGEVMHQKRESDQHETSSMENREFMIEEDPALAATEMLESSANEATGDPYRTHNGDETGNLASCQENPTTSMHENPSRVENESHQNSEKADITGDAAYTVDNSLTTELNEGQALKRRRLSPSLKGEGGWKPTSP